MPNNIPHETQGPAVRGEAAPGEFDRFFESTPSPMVVVAEDGCLLCANPACQMLTGFAAEELRDKPLFNFVHPDDREAAKLAIPEMNAATGGRTVELRMLCRDGGYKWTEWTGTRLAEREALCLIGKDASAAYAAVEKLTERARQQELVAELGRNALAAADLTSLMNETVTLLACTLKVEYAEIRELQPDARQLLLKAGWGWKDLPDTQKPVSADPDTVSGYMLSTDQPAILEDLRHETRFHGSPMLREHGVISGVGCVVPGPQQPYGVLAAYSERLRSFTQDDVHFLQAVANILAAAIDRKRGEEERVRFFERTLSPMVIIGFDGSYKYVNPALAEFTGCTQDEMLSRPYYSFFHPDDVASAETALAALHAGKPLHDVEVRFRAKDGSYRWLASDLAPDPERQLFYVISHDVTDRHRAEEALAERARQQQAVAELGVRALAGDDLRTLIDEAVAVLAQMLRVPFSTYLELQPGGCEFLFKAGYGWERELIGDARMPVGGQFLCGCVLASDKPVIVENLATESRFQAHPLAASHGICSEMGCVVPGADRPHGVICVHSDQPRRFGEDDVHFVRAVANILAAAIERRQAEEELNRFFEPSLSPMFVAGFDGTIKRCNGAMAALTGYTREELLARPLLSFAHPDDREAGAAMLQGMAAGSDVQAFEIRLVRKDGSERWTRWSGKTFADLQVVYATGQDITDRQLAEEALRANEEMLRAIGESALDGIVLLDPDGKVLHWNPAAEKSFGYSSDEMLGRNLHEMLVPGENRERYEQGWPHFRETGQGAVIGKVLELEALHKDGRRFPVEVSVAAVSLQGQWNAVGVVRDITERKLGEAELLAAKQAAEAANRSKSEFLANMSHEIRTPMNGVIGLTSLVLDTPLNKEQRQYLEGVMLSADALLRIINDILDFSKIEAGRLELERLDFDLRETLGNTMRALAVRAHEKGLELLYDVRAETPDALVGDPARLWQVLVNLVGNAIKFTDQGEVSLLVSVESLQSNAVCLQFTVRDTGIGIPADTQQTLFQPFSQVDSSMTRKYGGTGLGLAISAQIVEMMKGRIWFESELGKGSQFHFTAWFERRKAPLPKRSPLPPSGLDGLRALIVDDNATNRLILHNMLTHWGMRPDQADGGNAGLESLQTAYRAGDPYSLILLDVMMPAMDGFAVLEHIRQIPEIDRPVIMMLSSRDQPGDSTRAREMGAAAYIVKPVRPSELLAAIVKALNISFDVKAEADRPTAPPSVFPPTGPRLRILVAEDNPINQVLAVRILEKAGHSVAKANNGEEVLEAIAREAFDLVLMDVQMPVMDGLEATALIRQQEKGTGRRLPIIAMTAHAMKGDRERCLEAGMDGYIAKPVQTQELFAALAAAAPNPPDAR